MGSSGAKWRNSVGLLYNPHDVYLSLSNKPYTIQFTDQLFYMLQLNTDIYESDPELEQIRREQGYSYMDIITIHPDKLPNYEEKVTPALCTVISVHFKSPYIFWKTVTLLGKTLRCLKLSEQLVRRQKKISWPVENEYNSQCNYQYNSHCS